MTVICIKEYRDMTLHKTYEVVDQIQNAYWVVDDNGHNTIINEFYLKPLDEYRNNIIDKIL